MSEDIDSTAKIHSSAVIEEGAVIAEGSHVGPFSVIGPKVEIGKNCWIGSHVVIEGNTKIGDDNRIFQFASIGAVPQDLKYSGEDSLLKIGNGNVIREYVTLQPGTSGGHMATKIGDKNFFMACSHVGHDGVVGNYNVFANSCALAGHVDVGDFGIIGGLCGIHQFVRIGDHAMLGGGCMVTKDIPPFCRAQGDRAGLVGINQIGLERHGVSVDDIRILKRLYRELFFGSKTLNHRIESAREEYADSECAVQFLDFISSSERGVTFPRKRGDGSD